MKPPTEAPVEESEGHRVSRLAQRTGWVFMAMGALAILAPLLGSSVIAMFYPDNEVAISTIYNNFPTVLFFAALLLAFGLTILFSQVVDYSAVGAGTVKVFGLEMPVEFQGAAMMLLVLLLGIGVGVKQFDLISVKDDWGEWSELREDMAKAEAEIAALTTQIDALEVDKDRLTENMGTQQDHFETLQAFQQLQTERLQELLVAQSQGSGQMLELRFKCGRNQIDPAPVLWQATGNRKIGNLLLRNVAETGTEEVDEEELNPFRLFGDNSAPTYTIVSAENDFSDPEDVITASFSFDEGRLVATIWPGEVSLRELCDRRRSTSAAGNDGQVTVRQAQSQLGQVSPVVDWRDTVEQGTDF